MKKLLSIILFLFVINIAAEAASKVINTTEDGTKLKCTGNKTSGSISQYDNGAVDYYEFRDGKIYSHNMLDVFAKESKKKREAQPVKKLKISEEEISFKDTYYSEAWSNYKWATIDRNSGNYYFKAKRDNVYGGFIQKAEVTGKCVIVK